MLTTNNADKVAYHALTSSNVLNRNFRKSVIHKNELLFCILQFSTWKINPLELIDSFPYVCTTDSTKYSQQTALTTEQKRAYRAQCRLRGGFFSNGR